MARSVKTADMTEADRALMQKAELVASFLQSVTKGPEEGYTVLINATMILCNLCAQNKDGTMNAEQLKRYVSMLAAEWQAFHDNFDTIMTELKP